MKPSPSGDADHGPRTESEYAQVASLATKVAALPARDPYDAPDTLYRSARIRARSRVYRWLAQLFFLLVWLITLAMGVCAAFGTFHHDGTKLLIWINAFTRYVYLPAYVCLALALWKRRWWLAFASLAIITYHVVWLAPDFVRDRRFDAEQNNVAANRHSNQRVRIFFANVLSTNTQYAPMLREIREANPDVVILVECAGEWQQMLRAAPEISAFPYDNLRTELGIQPIVVLSKLPLAARTEDRIAERFIESIDIPIGSQILTVVGLHAPRPMAFRESDYDAYWNDVVPLLLSSRRPLVVVGDCNATQYSTVYQRLKAGGLRSAHEDRGRGYATTWPNGIPLGGWLPVPPIRIDQAFLSPEVECLGISEGEGHGSDHKPLVVDVQIRAGS